MVIRGLRVCGLALVFGVCLPSQAATAIVLPPDFEARTLATGLDVPVAATWAPDGRLFVAELSGRVRTVVGGHVLPEPLIDISDHVNHSGDRGLIGIAVDSDFSANHYLYLLYVFDDGTGAPDGRKTSRLTRVVVRPDNTVVNPAAPETVILGADDDAPCPAPSNDVDCIPADYIGHAVGTVRSDPDGTLWVGSGDASSAGWPDEGALRAYDPTSYAGKLLHVDRAGRGLPGHPYCASDANLEHTCTKVFARGFRNPYRFALRGAGRGPIVGDVGMSHYEEINLTAPGLNYGWPCWEGTIHTPTWQAEPACADVYAAGGTTPPDFAYPGSGDPNGGNTAVVGGPIYPGGEYPGTFNGDLLFGDWSQGWIRRLRLDQGGSTEEAFAAEVQVLDLQLAPSGNLAYVEAGFFVPGAGEVREIAYCPVNCAPVARAKADPSFGPAPLQVSFTGDTSTDPEGLPLSFDWDFGDGSPHSSLVNPVHEYVDDGVYTAVLTVTDLGGRAATASVPISVGNAPPRVSIDTPADGSLYVGGRPVELRGSGVDPEEGAVSSDALEWRVLLHHGNHIHPYGTFTGDIQSFAPATDHDADSFFEVLLTATDSAGLRATTSITLRPRTVPVTLDSAPPGAPLTWVSASVVAPFTTVSAAGFRPAVGAATTFTRDGRTYVFDSWSDGGARHHQLEVPTEGELPLTARYRDASPSPSEPPLQPDPLDTEAPDLTFDAGRAPRRAMAGRLVGRASDRSGVRSVQIAVRARRVRGERCRWWLAGQGRLASRPASCAAPRWIRATLPRGAPTASWRAALGRALPDGAYETLFRAVDERGNVTRKADGQSRVHFVVKRSGGG